MSDSLPATLAAHAAMPDMLSDEFSISAAARALRYTQTRADVPTLSDEAESPDGYARGYIEAMRRSLEQLKTPDFLIDFIASTWSRVILQSYQDRGAASEVDRLTKVGVALVMSTQPKTTAAQREAMERSMPHLITEIEKALRAFKVPPETRQAFFNSLMPAQAEALRGATAGTLSRMNGDSLTIHQALERVFNPRGLIPTPICAGPPPAHGDRQKSL